MKRRRPANLERVVRQAEVITKRLEHQQRRELIEYLNESYRRVRASLTREYPQAVKDAARMGTNVALRMARARVLLDQLDEALNALDPTRGPFPNLIRDGVTRGAELGRDTAARFLREYGVQLPVNPGSVNLERVTAIVQNATDRLSAHSEAAIRRIKQAVADGVTRGTGVQAVTREVKIVLIGDGRTPDAGLFHRAETIAITELGLATEAARKELYVEQGIRFVQRFVVQDERTCRVCAPRHGEVTRLDQTLEKLHPRCRDYLAPWKPEWREAGLTRDEEFRRERTAILAGLERRGVTPARGASVFEKAQGLRRPKPVWRL